MIAAAVTRPGDALDAHIEACAAANRTSLREFARHVGLLDDTDRFPALWGAVITDRHADCLNDALGIDAHSMTLHRYHPNTTNLADLDADRPTTMRKVLRRQWLYIAGSRFCPLCLGAGRNWQIAWKLPWTFACTTHRTWMHDVCPTCRRPPRTYGDKPTTQPAYPTALANTTRCPNRPATGHGGVGRYASPCGTDLAHVVASPCPTDVVETQRQIDGWLDGSTANILNGHHQTRDALHTLQAVCIWLDTARNDRDGERPWISPPTSAIDIGVRTRQALAVLNGDIQRGAEQLALPLAPLLTAAPSARTALRERTSRHQLTDHLADAIAARFERTTTRQRRRATQLLLPLNGVNTCDLIASIDEVIDHDALRKLTGVDNRADILRDAVTIDVLLGHGARTAAHAADLANLKAGAVKRHGYIRHLVNQTKNRESWLAHIDRITHP